MAGFFSESNLLYRHVSERLKSVNSEVQLFRTPACGSSVIKGAVLFGLDKKAIEKRTMDRTLGIRILERWQPRHEEVGALRGSAPHRALLCDVAGRTHGRVVRRRAILSQCLLSARSEG